VISAIQTSTGEKVIASYTKKENAPFLCPGCKSPVIIKKGLIKIHHFAHKACKNCNSGSPESELHMSCKLSIYNQINNLNKFENVEVEKIIGDFIADVYAECNGVKVAFEIQVSNMDVKKLLSKIKGYSKNKIYGFWVVPNYDMRNNERYSPKIWERLLHQLYHGQIYYMLKEGEIVSVTFKPYNLWKEATDWGGGYYYTSKRYVKLKINGVVDLADMIPKYHYKFFFSNITFTGYILVPSNKKFESVYSRCKKLQLNRKWIGGRMTDEQVGARIGELKRDGTIAQLGDIIQWYGK